MKPGNWREDPLRRGLAARLSEDVADRLQGLADEAVLKADDGIAFNALCDRDEALAFLGLCLAGHMGGENPPPYPDVVTVKLPRDVAEAMVDTSPTQWRSEEKRKRHADLLDAGRATIALAVEEQG